MKTKLKKCSFTPLKRKRGERLSQRMSAVNFFAGLPEVRQVIKADCFVVSRGER